MFNPAEAIYNLYETRNEPRERSLSHYPSGLCAINGSDFIGKCRRQLFYEMTGVERTDPIDGLALFKMDIGNMIHKAMNAQIDEALACYFEAEFEGDGYGEELIVKWEEDGLIYPISGRLDKRFREGSVVYGSEWKSTYGMGVRDVQKNGPKEDALLQVITYLRQRVYPVDKYILSYIARDSGFIYSYLFWYEDEKLQIEWLNSGSRSICPWDWIHIKAALLTVEESVESGKLPNRDYHAVVKDGILDKKSSWRCRYCGWRSLCYEKEIKLCAV